MLNSSSAGSPSRCAVFVKVPEDSQLFGVALANVSLFASILSVFCHCHLNKEVFLHLVLVLRQFYIQLYEKSLVLLCMSETELCLYFTQLGFDRITATVFCL